MGTSLDLFLLKPKFRIAFVFHLNVGINYNFELL